MTNPCKGCKERCAICHAQCQRYFDWSAERLRMLKANEKQNDVVGYVVDAAEKNKRRRKR